jgi:hypothetical protein
MCLVKSLIILFVFSLSLNSAVADEDYSTGVRYLHVQKGQTLHNIVRRLYPDRVDEWPKLTNDIVRLNPDAFINSDPGQMKADVRLELPKKVVVRSETAKPAKRKQVGTVAESTGSVMAVVQKKVSRKLAAGNPVYLGDKVITGEDGLVRLQMIDAAILDLRCFSIMVIEEYALNTTSRRSILNLLQGSLKKVTGQIGKMTEDVYELKTPVASIGVRGTEYALRVFQAKGCGGTVDTDDGLYLEVIKGLVDVHNEAGKEVFAKGETAYVSLPKTAPQKKDIKPGVLKPLEKTAEITKVMETRDNTDEGSNIWWWILGIVGVALLI